MVIKNLCLKQIKAHLDQNPQHKLQRLNNNTLFLTDLKPAWREFADVELDSQAQHKCFSQLS